MVDRDFGYIEFVPRRRLGELFEPTGASVDPLGLSVDPLGRSEDLVNFCDNACSDVCANLAVRSNF